MPDRFPDMTEINTLGHLAAFVLMLPGDKDHQDGHVAN